jgi:4-hydroxybenzoate polyprenyltransferase
VSAQLATPRSGSPTALVRAAHAGPTLAVTVLTAALALAGDLGPGRSALVTAAVLTGQLSIGWSNDLVDSERDRQVRRGDKPLATGEVSARTVQVACAAALVATVALSLACGLPAGLVQLLLVAAGWAYNLGLKSTASSWAPYAVAFGGLPVFVTLAEPGAGLPAAWVPLAGAMLGVGAHLVNALPDLADDEATGVRGLPHRLGARWSPRVAVVVLVAASVLIAVGAGPVTSAVSVAGLVLVAALAVAALVGGGRTPFRAALGIALVDVVLLVVLR